MVFSSTKTTTRKKTLKKQILIGCLTASAFLTPMMATMPIAHADWTDIVTGVINGANEYNYALMSTLWEGNNANNQNIVLNQTLSKSTPDQNPQDIAIVNSVMSRLINKGEFIMDAYSLPFRWTITDEDTCNAYCTAYNYVNIYSGLLTSLNYNEDEIAATLSHEMIHGLHHHQAKNYAKWKLQKYGYGFFRNLTQMQHDLLALAINYNTAKNISVPAEEDADENGFYILTSAGYNPGGLAALFTRFLELEEESPIPENFFQPSDHPSNVHRIELAEQQLSRYGYNHVTVKNGNEIYIDDQFLLRTTGSDTTLPQEEAYFIAGAIDKGLHTNRLAAMWYFKQNSDGTVDFLNDDPVYGCLKTAINQNNLGVSFEKMITNAYSNDSKTGNRDDINIDEQKRLTDFANDKTHTKEKLATDKETMASAKTNAYIYNELHLPDLALNIAQRLEDANPKDGAIHAIRGNSYAVLGDFDKAMQECNLAVAAKPKSPYVYVCRANAYALMGADENALTDCSTALSLNDHWGNAYKLQARILDKEGNYAAALQSYRNYKAVDPTATDIPSNYSSAL